MSPPCCAGASWVAERDLDGARGFEFEVGRCARCGTPWMHAYCVASSIGGFEPISREEAEKLKALPADEVKAAMRVWAGRIG